MKVLCKREHLRDALGVVNGVIPIKSTRQAIENVYLAATDDALELVGTDLEVAVRYRIGPGPDDAGDEADIKVEDPGAVLIPARIAAEFVRDLSGDTVTLTADETTCTITSGNDRCELVVADTDEFPVVPRFEEEDSLPIQGGILNRLVSRTSFAAAREAGRYAMHGILTLVEDETLRMVATDGRRLAVASAPIEAPSSGGKKGKQSGRRAIVPTKGMQLFGRVIDDPLETVRVHFGENQIGLKTRRAEIFARLLDGEFPRYQAVIPQSSSYVLEADSELFNRKLRLVSNVTASDTRAVKLAFSKGQLDIHARSSGCGEASAQMEIKYKGKAAEIAFNPDYLMDGLKNCESETVQFEFNESTAPGKLCLGEDYFYVVMPITIDT